MEPLCAPQLKLPSDVQERVERCGLQFGMTICVADHVLLMDAGSFLVERKLGRFVGK